MSKTVETLIASSAASLDIVKTLENPPKPNRALTKAMRDYKKAKIPKEQRNHG